MKCPKCNHVSTTAPFTCSACGETYDRHTLETLGHLNYLLAWLDRREVDLTQGAYTKLQAEALSELKTLRSTLGLETAAAVATAAPPAAQPAQPTPLPPTPTPLASVTRPAQEIARELNLLDATLMQIPDWVRAVLISRDSAQNLRQHFQTQRVALRGQLGEAYRPASPSNLSTLDFALEQIKHWAADGYLTASEAKNLRAYLLKQRAALTVPTPASTSVPVMQLAPIAASALPAAQPAMAAPAPMSKPSMSAPPPPPPPPTKPTAPPPPPVNWTQVWESAWNFVVSGALLRGLLYLGAFMIVVSAVVLVIRFWNNFHPLLQIGFIAAVPLSFYLGGFLLREWLKIPVAGGVITGIGALLVGVDFVAVYQLAGLAGHINPNVYWLSASLVCTVIYAFTTWRVRGEFFAYITLLGWTSSLLALAGVLRLPLEWHLVVVSASALGMTGLAIALKEPEDRWRDLANASRRLPQLLLPATLFLALVLLLFVPGDESLGQTVIFLLAMLSYSLLAWQFPAFLLALAAVGSSVGALGFAFQAIELPGKWYAAAAALCAPVYLLTGRWLARTLRANFVQRRSYVTAVYSAGFGLVLIAITAGLITLVFDLWAGILALTLAALVLAWSAYLFRFPALVFFAAGLFIVPFTLALYRWLGDFHIPQMGAWAMIAWIILAFSYLIVAAGLRMEKYVRWLNLWALGLVPLALMGLLVNYAFAEKIWFNSPTLVGLASAILFYVAAAILHDGGQDPALSKFFTWLPASVERAIFLWPIGILLPVWVAVAWDGSALPRAGLGVAVAGMALSYVGLGQLLSWRKIEYRFPLHVYAYGLAALGVVIASEEKWLLMTALYLAVAVSGALAFVYRRIPETMLAATLFIWPFQLSLELSPLTPHVYSLAYALLASLVYIPLGLALNKAGRKYAWPEYVIGYGLAAYAVCASLLGRFQAYPVNLPWVGVVTPLIVVGLLIFSEYRFRNLIFAWAAALVFPIAFSQALTLLKFPMDYQAATWVGLALIYLLAERLLALLASTELTQTALRLRAAAHPERTLSLSKWQSKERRAPLSDSRRVRVLPGIWFSAFRWPLGVVGGAVCALGWLLTAPATALSFIGGRIENYLPLIVTQGLVIGVVILAAWLYESRWPLYLEPGLAFVLFTLCLNGYSEPLIGHALTIWQYGPLWSMLALPHLFAALLLDRTRARYAHGLYLGGYALIFFAIAWTAFDQAMLLWTLGLSLLVALGSALLEYYGAHRSFDDLIHFVWPRPEPATVMQRAARTAFLFFAAYAFPIWLAELMTYYQAPPAWRGLGLTLAAPIYIAFGLAVRRVRVEYTWPLYSAGYTLTAIGALATFGDEQLTIYALILDSVIYAASAYIFRQAFWLYLSTFLVPVVALLTLDYNAQLTPAWLVGVFMGLAFIYWIIGQCFDRRKGKSRGGVSSFALPFYVPGYLLSLIALAVSSGERVLALEVYSAGVVLYALSAWAFAENLFIYPAAWLAAVPYYLAMTFTPLPPPWYGVGWLPLIVTYIVLGRFVFHTQPVEIKDGQTLLAALSRAPMPFYLLAYALSVSMLVISQPDPLIFTVSLAAGTVVYLASAALFRRPVWLYPGLLAMHIGLMSYFTIHPTSLPPYYLTFPFFGLTWVLALIGYAFTQLAPVAHKLESRNWNFPSIGYLLTPSWAQPFFHFVALDVIFWQVLALSGFESAIILAVGHAILFGLLAMLWDDTALAYGALGFGLLAVGYRLHWAGVPFPEAMAWIGGLGFGLYLLARIIERARHPVLNLWRQPLTNMAVGLTALAVITTLPTVVTQTTAASAALALAGALYLTQAYRGRYYRLGYLGMAMLQTAWALALVVRDVEQPQWYAIPAGLYFIGIGFLERRRARGLLAVAIETFGLSVLLLTAFIQSLDGATGFPYFVLLLVEALLVIWWGAARRFKIPFFIGLGASALNVLAQVVILINVYDINRWLIILSVGLLLVILAIFVERQRALIIAKAQEWREVLETWE